jgi:arsenite methyltransferase
MGGSWAADPPPLVAEVYGRLMWWLNARANGTLFEAAGVRLGTRAVEIGCGPGYLLARLGEAVGPDGHVVGVDPSPSLRRMAARANAAAIATGRVEVVEGTAEAIPVADGSTDVVLSAHSFQFWPDPGAAFAEIRRTLRPGGLLVLLLRLHGPTARARLPNPLSRSPDEVGSARAGAERAGFAWDGGRGALLRLRRGEP